MDPLYWLSRAPIPGLIACRTPRDLASVTDVGADEEPRAAGVALGVSDRVWRAAERIYHSGAHPALQLCILRHGRVVLNRSLGHVSGNAPKDPISAPKVPASVETPFNIFSASKAITAMVIHKLDEKRVLHLEDRVCDYVPEFARHGKHRITLRHILSHRAGIPNLPPEAIDLDLVGKPEQVVEILCDSRLSSRPGRLLAYHAVSGGFVLAEVVRRATGRDIRQVLEREILEPLGLRWMRYGVAPADVSQVAVNAFTGPPVTQPFTGLLRRALGTTIAHAVELSNDPRFVTGIIPSANVMTTARELAAFYQCLLDEGELAGVRIFDPRTVRHATSEQSIWEIDLTLGLPLRYGLGFMLGSKRASMFGVDNPLAFGHLGLSNVFSWADPERDLVVALNTSGKPVVGPHMIRIVELLVEISRAFPKLPGWERESRLAERRSTAKVA